MRSMKRAERLRRLMNRRGQSFLEYMIILGVVIVLLVAFANGPFRDAMNNTLASSSKTMDGATAVMDGTDLTAAKNW